MHVHMYICICIYDVNVIVITHTPTDTPTHTHTRVLPWELFGPYNHSLFCYYCFRVCQASIIAHWTLLGTSPWKSILFPVSRGIANRNVSLFCNIVLMRIYIFPGRPHRHTHTHCSHTQTHSHTHWDYLGMCCDPWISHLFCIIAFGFVRLPLLLHGLSWAPPQESHFC
jgi:hypothetical protein